MSNWPPPERRRFYESDPDRRVQPLAIGCAWLVMICLGLVGIAATIAVLRWMF